MSLVMQQANMSQVTSITETIVNESEDRKSRRTRAREMRIKSPTDIIKSHIIPRKVKVNRDEVISNFGSSDGAIRPAVNMDDDINPDVRANLQHKDVDNLLTMAIAETENEDANQDNPEATNELDSNASDCFHQHARDSNNPTANDEDANKDNPELESNNSEDQQQQEDSDNLDDRIIAIARESNTSEDRQQHENVDRNILIAKDEDDNQEDHEMDSNASDGPQEQHANQDPEATNELESNASEDRHLHEDVDSITPVAKGEDATNEMESIVSEDPQREDVHDDLSSTTNAIEIYESIPDKTNNNNEDITTLCQTEDNHEGVVIEMESAQELPSTKTGVPVLVTDNNKICESFDTKLTTNASVTILIPPETANLLEGVAISNENEIKEDQQCNELTQDPITEETETDFPVTEKSIVDAKKEELIETPKKEDTVLLIESSTGTNEEESEAEKKEKLLILIIIKAMIDFLNSKNFMGLLLFLAGAATVAYFAYKNEPTPLVFDKELFNRFNISNIDV